MESSQNKKSHQNDDNHENLLVETIATQLTEYVRTFLLLLFFYLFPFSHLVHK